MSGCIVKVWFEPEESPGKGRFQIIETEMPDFATFCEFLDADRLIGGAILWTRKGQTHGEQVIVSRRPCAFRGAAVLRCELPSWMYVDEGQA